MAMTRRSLLLGLPAALTMTACGAARTTLERDGYEELRRAGAGSEKILVCMPNTAQTREVLGGLTDELGADFQVVAVRVSSRDDFDLLDQAIRRHQPRALVLMNNPTVAAYRSYLARHPDAQRLPAVVVMTSFVEEHTLTRLGATGISYEIPLITVVTNLRRVLAVPVDRVGVIYREPLSRFVQQQTELARRERIAVVETVVSSQPNSSEVKQALRHTKQRADALWVLNDDILLSPRLIAHGWLPGLNERPWRPVIVGAASLVSEAQSLGTLAVLPDHTALGVQAADLIFEIADNGWHLSEGVAAQLPLSTTTTVDLRIATERFELRRGALAQVDRIIR